MARLFATDDAGTLEAPLLNQTPLGNVMSSVRKLKKRKKSATAEPDSTGQCDEFGVEAHTAESKREREK